MSDNKKKSNGRRGDSFAVPGDENIVSNKGFLISVPKLKKGPSNPLLESEKNKEKAREARKNEEKRGETRPGAEKGGDKGGDRAQKSRHGHKKHHHGPRPAGNQSGVKPAETARPEERRSAPAQTDKARDNQGENRRPKNKKHRFDDRKKGQRPPMPPKEAQKEGAQAVKPEEKRPTSDRNDKKRPHKKHKKEKFVPMAPETDSGELLQPIVDRTEILSGGMPSRPVSFSGFSRNTSSADRIARDENGKEIRFVDRNRPLAEQIAEAEKRVSPAAKDVEGGVEVIGVRFREAGKIYYFAPGNNKVKAGQAVIVETARGVEYGFCAIGNRFVGEDQIVPPLKPIIRIATDADTERYKGNKLLEESAAKLFREKVKKLGLEMSLVYVEYTFDNGKVLFYFTADGRVDFRELIKELAAAFKTRIELRQIGVRDEAKIVGGLGICGRPVCCKSFLGEFSQVSIKMAKDQNLFINSSKISGTCGRFMCCIRYEDETYQKEYEKTPKVDAIVETPEGRGVVVESNALAGSVKVLLDEKADGAPIPFKCAEVKLLGYLKKAEKEIEIDESLLGD